MELDPLPECLNHSLCREIHIRAQVPLEFALYLYGYFMPFIVAVTVASNSFIVLVLSHRYLQTPTNIVLLAMAVTELLTGLSCLPWLLYYYTFDGYKTDELYGLPSFWCTMFPYMASILPSIFHTAAIWLTVYLAVQRYIYICVPKLAIAIICITSIWIYAPELFATYNLSYTSVHPITNDIRRICLRVKTSFIQLVGSNIYYYIIYALHTLVSHTVPCILLVIFTWRLIVAIREADRRHAYLTSSSTSKRRYTISANESSPSKSPNASQEFSSTSLRNFKRISRLRGSMNESKRIQGIKQNTRMLLVVIILFLITEIPAAMIFSLHVSTVALQITYIQQQYNLLNKLLIVRNVLIVMSYPFRFAIYCGMSQQFREVVRSMLTEKVFFPCDKKAKDFGRPGRSRPTNETTQFSDERRNQSDGQNETWNKQVSINDIERPSGSFIRESLLESATVLQSPAAFCLIKTES
uniref:G-protein coupled receptors family 1 profile domain-containing protein n=1 Tax=Panagrolaimus sp. ES5 TaxID=591445 RepID=A0AC34GRS7_9BILA